MIARRARRLGSRRASHLVDVERKRSCTGSVHSSGSFCTKLKAWTPRTPLSWFAAGAPDQMPAARGPDMHHASLCAGTYPQGLRDANGLAPLPAHWLAVGRCGEEASAGFLLRGKQERIQWSIRPLTEGFKAEGGPARARVTGTAHTVRDSAAVTCFRHGFRLLVSSVDCSLYGLTDGVDRGTPA